MSYRFIYSNFEKNRIIPAVLIDKRASIPSIANQSGTVIKTITDNQTALVDDNCLFYKIESNSGNLAGYFTLKKIREGVVSLLQYELRPAFEQFNSVILAQISNFISDGTWKQDSM